MKKLNAIAMVASVLVLLCGICQANEADATVDCKNGTFLSNEDAQNTNGRDPGGWMRWTIYATPNTWV